jgi:hypothetical protein
MRSPSVLSLAAIFAVLTLASPARAQFGGMLNVNVPVSGIFTPRLPLDGTGKPFIDYQLYVNAPGTYQIDLHSSNTAVYDPYLTLIQNGGQIAGNDDGAGGLNSRILQFLQPGMYIVRVTRFGSGPVAMPVSFSLSVLAAATPQPQPSLGQPLDEGMARTLAIRYYSTQSEWAGQYGISIMQTRMVPLGPDQAEVHIQYQYTCLRNQCGGGRFGSDQRVFYYQRYGTQWQVVRMGPHMSAVF